MTEKTDQEDNDLALKSAAALARHNGRTPVDPNDLGKYKEKLFFDNFLLDLPFRVALYLIVMAVGGFLLIGLTLGLMWLGGRI